MSRGLETHNGNLVFPDPLIVENIDIILSQLQKLNDKIRELKQFMKDDRVAGRIFNLTWAYFSYGTGGNNLNLTRCSADGALSIWRAHLTAGIALHEVGLISGSTWVYDTGYDSIFPIAVNPAGTRAAYIIGATLYKLDALGNVSTVSLGANRAADEGCLDVTDDPYLIAGLENGDIEVYDDSLTLKAAIDYGLADTPIAVVRRTS